MHDASKGAGLRAFPDPSGLFLVGAPGGLCSKEAEGSSRRASGRETGSSLYVAAALRPSFPG